MKKTNKFLAIILAILMMVSTIPITASAATYSGTCGENLTWNFDEDTGTLTISGEGDMDDFNIYFVNTPPWDNVESSIESVIINSGVTTIGKNAFYSYDNLKCVEISDTVTHINSAAFYGCNSLESITIPNSVISIGSSAFLGCNKLTSLTIPDSVTTLGNSAFELCSKLASVTIGSGVTAIGDGLFENCHKLTSITIPDNVTSIGNTAFYYCRSLTSITIPDSVISIGNEAFYGCDNLVSVIIGDGVTTIGTSAFEGCDSLTDITIGDSLTTIGERAFVGPNNLTSVLVDSNNQYYSNDENGILFNKDKTTLVYYTGDNTRTIYTIPDSVTTIGEWAFALCDNITNVTIPDSVTTIGLRGFYLCKGLTDVTIPDSVTVIGEWAFAQCKGITSIAIPSKVTTIETHTFYECENLTTATISYGVTSIGGMAFGNCRNLTSITIPDSVTYIGDYAFNGCKKLEIINIGIGIESIRANAFKECENLSDVYYSGTEEQWYNNVSIDGNNDQLKSATIHFTEHVHNYEHVTTAPTCTEQGYTTYTCECGDSYVGDYVDALGHTEETIPAVAPTCTETGLTEGAKCSVCGETLTEQKELPANGHDYNNVVTVPTCNENGYTTYTCSACGDTYIDDYVDATGHTSANAVEENYVAPTCTLNGSKDVVVYCSVCNTEISRTTETIEMLGHADNDYDDNCDECGEQLEYIVLCDHNCHKEGISGFFWRIINIFNMLFGLNKYCECGVAHY